MTTPIDPQLDAALDDLVRRIHFAQESLDELTDEDLHKDIPRECQSVITEAKARLAVIVAEAQDELLITLYNKKKPIDQWKGSRGSYQGAYVIDANDVDYLYWKRNGMHIGQKGKDNG